MITQTVPTAMHAIVRSACANNYKAIADSTWKTSGCCDELEALFSRKVSAESAVLCSRKVGPFFAIHQKSLEEFSFAEQEKEVEKKAPLLWKTVMAAGSNKKSLARNKLKNLDAIKPMLLTAVAIILRSRNQQVNMNALVHSMILRRGGADKMTYKRLNKLGFCTSYVRALACQSGLGKDNLSVVKQWADKCCGETATTSSEHNEDESRICATAINESMPLLDTCWKSDEFLDISLEANDLSDRSDVNEQLSAVERNTKKGAAESYFLDGDDDFLNISFNFQNIQLEETDGNEFHRKVTTQLANSTTDRRKSSSFILAGDNVNLSSKARHTTRAKGNEQKNLFNCIATKTRIPFQSDSIKGRIPLDTDPCDAPLASFLPGHDENSHLRSEFRHKIATTLIKYVKDVSWFEHFLPNSLPQKHGNSTKSKSETVRNPCGAF